MKRWFATFLLLLVPLQISWAATASYCQHEPSRTAQHFGHHTHQHQTPDGSTLGSMLGVDVDCTSCHAGCLAALHGSVALPILSLHSLLIPQIPHLPAEPPGDQPERPNWSKSA